MICGAWLWFAVDSDRLGLDPAAGKAPRTRAERIDDPPEILTAA